MYSVLAGIWQEGKKINFNLMAGVITKVQQRVIWMDLISGQ